MSSCLTASSGDEIGPSEERWLHLAFKAFRHTANDEDRRRVMRQLSKGEALHELRAYLVIANKGQLHRKRCEEPIHQVSR